jgi:hypothetical protein
VLWRDLDCAPHPGQKVGCRLSTVTVHARSRRSTPTTFKPAPGDHVIDLFIAPCCRIPSQGASRPASSGVAPGVACTKSQSDPAWTRKTYGKDFDRLAAADRVAALKAMEDGTATFENFDARAFFGQLHALTMAGFFSDPIYGGNRDKVAWKMLGFPGLPATYADKIDAYRDKRYVADPQSIADFS